MLITFALINILLTTKNKLIFCYFLLDKLKGIVYNKGMETENTLTGESKMDDVKRITAAEWKKTHRDYKSIINGQRFVLGWTDKGTGLIAVEIIKK